MDSLNLMLSFITFMYWVSLWNEFWSAIYSISTCSLKLLFFLESPSYFLLFNWQDEKTDGTDPIYKRRRKFCGYLEVCISNTGIESHTSYVSLLQDDLVCCPSVIRPPVCQVTALHWERLESPRKTKCARWLPSCWPSLRAHPATPSGKPG